MFIWCRELSGEEACEEQELEGIEGSSSYNIEAGTFRSLTR